MRRYHLVRLAVIMSIMGALSTAFAQDQKRERPKTAEELLQELQADPLRGKAIVVPPPASIGTPPTANGSSTTGTSKALRNLKEEEADRTQRRILEQLK